MNKLRLLFLGTSSFAVPILQALSDWEEVEVVGVVTQPGKSIGRDHVVRGSSVEQLVIRVNENVGFGNIPVYAPVKLSAAYREILEDSKPDLIVVVAYGQIVPQEMINAPRFGAINVHGSLLPRWRGAVPVHMGVLHGDASTGITVQKMVYELDAGPILFQQEVALMGTETTEQLLLQLSQLSAQVLPGVISRYVSGQIMPVEQKHAEATFCRQSDIAKDKARIMPNTEAKLAERMIRAFLPWPVAWVVPTAGGQSNKIVKIYRAHLIPTEVESSNPQLQIIKVGKELQLALPGGVLVLDELQVEGNKRRVAADYLSAFAQM